MNKKKQASITRRNRIRTQRQQAAAVKNRERRGLMLELEKMEAEEKMAERDRLLAELNAQNGV